VTNKNLSDRDARARVELDKIYLGQLPVICAVVFFYYTFITAMHFVFLPQEILVPIAGTSMLAAVSAATLAFAAKNALISPQKSHLAFAPVALAVLLTVFTHIFLAKEQIQLTNAILVLFAFGFVTLSRWVFTLVLTLGGFSYVIALAALPGPYSVHFAFMLLAAVAVSILGFSLRYRALYKSIRLLAGSRAKTRRLATATRQIKRKMEEAQQANAARDIFLANVTHELRTPLTGVMGMLDLVKDSSLNEDQSVMVGTAQKSAKYLMNIVNDLLDFAKLEAGKIELNKKPFDPNDISLVALETFRGAANAKNLTLNYLPSDTVPGSLKGDAARISQVLLNLINNAVKFTDKGHVSLKLEYSAAANQAIWSITDTGAGIASDQLNKLFERFGQVDNSKTRTQAGTGLGLAIVEELVTLMGGSIQVDSKVGQGSIFMVTLPLTVAASGEKIQDIEERSSADGAFTNQGLRTLVAEDNEINQVLITKVLEKLGIPLVMANDGAEAVAAVENAEQPFDLIFMDVQMPIMDGITATRKIRDMGCITPIIAITANTMEQDLDEYLAAGMNTSVGKPINLQKFEETIRSFIS
jgi:signal transduction histidine kinase/CheY-like chemotaxis protein